MPAAGPLPQGSWKSEGIILIDMRTIIEVLSTAPVDGLVQLGAMASASVVMIYAGRAGTNICLSIEYHIVIQLSTPSYTLETQQTQPHYVVEQSVIAFAYRIKRFSWHGNAFHITGPLWGNATFVISLNRRWTNYCRYNDLRRHNAHVTPLWFWQTGFRVNFKMPSHRHRKAHFRNKTISHPLDPHNNICFVCKTVRLLWNRLLITSKRCVVLCILW